MRKFFTGTKGSVIVIVAFTVFWYLIFRNALQIGISLFIVSLFYGVDEVRKKVSRKPQYIHYKIFSRKLSENQQAIIRRNYAFYRRLKPDFQRSFDDRVAGFLKHYRIIGRQGMILDEEKKILIASCYIQLTFGMYTYLNDSFNTILVYPDYYFSSITRQDHLGEFNPGLKIVVFSWKHFFDGIKNDNNNYNLGIHEFSHAILSSSRKKNSNNQTVAESDFAEGYREINKILQDRGFYSLVYNSEYLRKYAFTNSDEFISVILEHFFETPHEFKARLPELFEIVKKMINYREEWFQS